MQLKINDKKYILNFGLEFLNQVNKNESPKMEVEGQEISAGIGGLSMFMTALNTYEPTALYRLIKYATFTENQKPSNKDIDEYIDNLINDGQYYDIYDEIIEEMGKQPKVKIALNGNEKIKLAK